MSEHLLWNILLHFGLMGVEIHKIRKMFFLPIYKNFAIQNNPLMQLFLIFHKTNWKSENFKVLVDWEPFQHVRKLWKEGGEKFIFFLSLFLTAHINFQYKLKYCTSLFIVTFYWFPSIALLIFFFNLQFHCFFFL